MRTLTRRELLGHVIRGVAAAPIARSATVDVVHRALFSRSAVVALVADWIDRLLPH